MDSSTDSKEPLPHAAEADELVDPMLGVTVGKYRVEKKLGEGGMGAVYRMRHLEIPETFLALKVLTLRAVPGDAAATREMAERFAQEARAASAVGSHRVVQVVDVGQFDDGTRYLMMEYVPGRSIGQAVEQDGPMDVRKALLLCARVADTLAIAHQRGIIHRDVKPQNLMLVDEGDDPMVKILDFGVSRATGDAKIAHTTERKIIGSPGYMAPEAAIGTPVDGRADVFSLAATLFEMLTGQLPFRGNNFPALMMATIQDAIPPARDVRPRHLPPVPEAVEAVLAWGLTKDPSVRPSMAEFRAALVEAAEAQAQPARRGSGPVLASVMRNFTPSPSDRPTLSAGAAEASEILARYGTPPPSRAATPQPQSDATASAARAVDPATPIATVGSGGHSAPTRGVAVIDPTGPTPAPRPRSNVPLISAIVVVLSIAVVATAMLWPRKPTTVSTEAGSEAARAAEQARVNEEKLREAKAAEAKAAEAKAAEAKAAEAKAAEVKAAEAKAADDTASGETPSEGAVTDKNKSRHGGKKPGREPTAIDKKPLKTY